ncbi:MAG TPA: polysaccharide biosynthesis tyrosine autokinase [Gemmatimonadaceae bacterium]|nr:polysaccharide biosynthesis tyrosine autokinase [Gemmatimonadaceae bacterium]
MFDLMRDGANGRAPVPVDASRAPAALPLDPAADAGPDWRRAAAALRRHKWSVLVVTALAAAGGWFAARVVPPQYEARATIWIDESDQRADRSPLAPGDLFDAQGWVELMKSNVVLDSVAVERRLFATVPRGADPTVLNGLSATARLVPGRYVLTVDAASRRFALRDARGRLLEDVAAGDTLGKAIGVIWQPSPALAATTARYEFTLERPHAVALRLADALEVTINPRASLLTAVLAGRDAEQTAGTLNAIAQRYVQLATTLQHQRVTELTDILSRQVAAASVSLDAAERDLEAFRVRTITLPHDRAAVAVPGSGPAASDMTTAEPVLQRFTAVQDQLAAARADRDAVERLVTAAADSATSLGPFEDLPVVARSPGLAAAFREYEDKQAQLRAMRQRYTDAYPAVVQLRTEVAALRSQTIPRVAGALLVELTHRTAVLTGEVARTADSLRAIPQRATEEARLMRSVAMATSLYNTLQQRYDEARIARTTNVSDVRILDRAAVPPTPTKNTEPRILLLAVLGGFGLATVGTVLRDRWDPRFRYPEQVSRDMGVAILGSLPHVHAVGDGAAADPAFRDAVRGVRMNLSYAYGTAGPMAFTVTSPGSVDGKSFVALHVARAFAEMGRRTVLLDGDVRRGTLHRRCRVARKPGLVDYLNGDLALDDVIQPTAFPNVSLVPSGTRADQAPELLASPPMQRLMAELRSRFDVIVCDSPPLSAGIDPFVLGATTGNMLLVIRPGVSLRQVMQTKLEVLDRMPVRLLGAVLNDVPGTAPYVYYSHYLPGYETANERLGAGSSAAVPAEAR